VFKISSPSALLNQSRNGPCGRHWPQEGSTFKFQIRKVLCAGVACRSAISAFAAAELGD
jgi:hypothetical protein